MASKYLHLGPIIIIAGDGEYAGTLSKFKDSFLK